MGVTGIEILPGGSAEPAGSTTDPAAATGLGLANLQRALRIPRGQRVAVLNAPATSRLRLTASVGPGTDRADVVVGFAARPVDLAGLAPAFAAAHRHRVVWILYPRTGRPGTDLRREWLVRAVARHGTATVEELPVDEAWSAVRLRPIADRRRAALSVVHGGRR